MKKQRTMINNVTRSEDFIYEKTENNSRLKGV
jgi:hypothetical protein